MRANPYEYITRQKEAYRSDRVPLAPNWEWNMLDHITKSFLYKNSKFSQGADDGNRPFKNIIRPILNVAHRSEGFDVKDIEPFVNDPDNYYKSFLVRKYHPKWARENDIDTFIDELVESYVDYGLALVKNVNAVRPEVVPLQRIAFCDQTDILSGAICEVHNYTVDQLVAMKGKWYDDEIDETILMAEAQKTMVLPNDQKAATPSPYIEVYELHGQFPETWLKKDGDADTDYDEKRYSPQIHIVTFYTSQDGRKNGICLFKGPEKTPIYKAIKRDGVFGRACGFGGVEELFDAQVWTNYSELQLKEMLDVAGLMLLQTTDEAFANRNKVTDLTKGEILVTAEGRTISAVDTRPINKEAFEANVVRWEQAARTIGSASDPQLGLNPVSGTPLGTTEIVTDQGVGIHEYRQGKIATFVGEIYRDWVLPRLVKEINKGQKFLEELSVKELREIAEKVIHSARNNKIKQKIISGQIPNQDEMDLFEEVETANFMKGGTKRFFEALENELADLPVDVHINIKGKQKNLALMVSKLNAIFRGVFANPAILQHEGMADLFNQIIESAGLSPIDFSTLTTMPEEEQEEPAPVEPAPVPVPELSVAT